MRTVIQSQFHRINAPELLEGVWRGVEFVDGVKKTQAEKSPDSQQGTAA